MGVCRADGKDGTMNFSCPEYLPDSESRVRKLQALVRGRAVAVLAAGPSLGELESRIEELRTADICYFGVNHFTVVERHILQKIDRQFSVVLCSCCEAIPQVEAMVLQFLERPVENVFISSFSHGTSGLPFTSKEPEKFLQEHGSKMLFFGLRDSGASVPSEEEPLHFNACNSLLGLILMAVISKPSMIVLFGSDGYCAEGAVQYYRPEEYLTSLAAVRDILVGDVGTRFNPIAGSSVENTRKTYGLPEVKILNCSEYSFYEPFPKVSYDVAFAELNRKETTQ